MTLVWTGFGNTARYKTHARWEGKAEKEPDIPLGSQEAQHCWNNTLCSAQESFINFTGCWTPAKEHLSPQRMRTSHSSWRCLEKSTSEAVTARVEEQPREQPPLTGELVLHGWLSIKMRKRMRRQNRILQDQELPSCRSNSCWVQS